MVCELVLIKQFEESTELPYFIVPGSKLKIGDEIEWKGEIIRYEGENCDSIWEDAIKAGRKIVISCYALNRNQIDELKTYKSGDKFRLLFEKSACERCKYGSWMTPSHKCKKECQSPINKLVSFEKE